MAGSSHTPVAPAPPPESAASATPGPTGAPPQVPAGSATPGPAGAPPLASLTESAAWRVATRSILFTFGLVFAIWLAVRLEQVIIQALLAVILAAGMTPIVDRLAHPKPLGIGERMWTPPRALVVLVLYLLLLLVVSLVIAIVVPPVVEDFEDLVRRLPRYGDAFEAWLESLVTRFPFLQAIQADRTLAEQLAASAGQLVTFAGQALVVVQVAVDVLAAALNGIFILILALYITVDRERIQRYLIGFLPADRQVQARSIASRIGDRLGGWLRGQVLLSAIIGALTFVGLTAIGIRYPVLLALVAAIGEAIPMIGPIISAIPAVIIAFFHSPLQGLLTLGLYIVIQQLENNLIVPKVMERAVALHPLAVMLALLAGAELLGVTGAILSLPVAAALAVVIDEIRRERQLMAERKEGTVGDQPVLLTAPKPTPTSSPQGPRGSKSRRRP
ncbi:MAG: AI-2E family transporter [Chloroflexi bacterium]|nr:AI-2E family transporter [Chloroflexota bacterium]